MQNIDNQNVRPDHKAILELIKPRTSVLDLGSGTGELLHLLSKEKLVKGQGIEIDDKAVFASVEKGISVYHGDIDSGLAEYRDKSFDYVILNQSLQQIAHVENVVDDALRVGHQVIVGIPNFVYWKSRFQLSILGRTPITSNLPYKWYETPNVRFLTIYDFIDFCKRKNLRIEKKVYIGEKHRLFILPNLFANTGIFVLSRKDKK